MYTIRYYNNGKGGVMKKFSLEECNDKKRLELIAKELKSGKIFVFPTSTLYGIGCTAYDKNAVDRIYKIKNRPYEKSLIVLVSNIKMAKSITKNISNLEEKLMQEFWPGNLTIILEKEDVIPDIVTSGTQYVAVRMDSNSTINKIIDNINSPIVAPSANFSGDDSVSKSSKLNKKLLESVDYFIDAGEIENGECSTLVKCENQKIVILREGKIKKEDIESKGFMVI